MSETAQSPVITQCGVIFRKCNIIANHYGHPDQSRMLQEEAAELIQAVNKYWRNVADIEKAEAAEDNLVEEMADVIIMIIQECQLLHIDKELFVDEIINKLDRQIKRIKEEV